ncbi:hypothetical protein BD413DRAFT_196455 [Trametes elegans]|nr:hypothetical protein BD413DRAFT_196455 [Trametes elegans]
MWYLDPHSQDCAPTCNMSDRLGEHTYPRSRAAGLPRTKYTGNTFGVDTRVDPAAHHAERSIVPPRFLIQAVHIADPRPTDPCRWRTRPIRAHSLPVPLATAGDTRQGSPTPHSAAGRRVKRPTAQTVLPRRLWPAVMPCMECSGTDVTAQPGLLPQMDRT